MRRGTAAPFSPDHPVAGFAGSSQVAGLPELPEVETTRRGIAPHLQHQRITSVTVRQPRLRWPIPAALVRGLPGQRIAAVNRRGKYLLLDCTAVTVLIHLGMSGSLRIVDAAAKPGKHDHFDVGLGSGKRLRYTDPRRFGCLLWHHGDINQHRLIRHLGPEPLTRAFTGQYLQQQGRQRRTPVKSLVMDSRVVVGVGNIYANEALFLAGINPRRAANRIARPRYDRLARCIKQVLTNAIAVGGTTLRDFANSSGEPGYFRQSLTVYGRGAMACKRCQALLKEVRLAQRSTVYCVRCQR